MHKNTLPAWFILRKLADGFEKRQAFDVTDSPADFAQHKINFFITDF